MSDRLNLGVVEPNGGGVEVGVEVTPTEEPKKETPYNFFDQVGGFLDSISGLLDKLKKAGIIKPGPGEEAPIVTIPAEEKPKFWEQPYFPWLIGGGIAAGGVGTILYMKKKRR